MADKLMYISNDVTQNYPFRIFMFIKVPKVFKRTIKETLGTSVINSSLSHLKILGFGLSNDLDADC